jgi:hypothetical protein
MLNSLLTWIGSKEPAWGYNRIWLDAVVVLAACSLLLWATLPPGDLATNLLFAENGQIEALQEGVLTVAALVALVGFVRRRGLPRYIAMFTGLVSAIFSIRETEVCTPGLMDICVPEASHTIIITILAVLLLTGTLVYEFRNRGGVMKAASPRVSWPLALCACALFAGQLWESLHIVAGEEMLELYAYLILLLGALWISFARRWNAVN